MELDASILRGIIENADDVFVVTRGSPLDEPGPQIVYVNPAFTRLTGYRPEEVIGRSPRLLQGPDTDPETRARIRAALETGEGCQVTILNYAKDGASYWLDMKIVPLRDRRGRFSHFAAVERDVSDSVARQEALTRKALTDPLTGLANRRAFEDAAQRGWAGAARRGEPMSLALVDVDRFKQINDRFGHHSGDEVLRGLSAAAGGCVRGCDLVARIGGEEFAVLMPATAAEPAALAMERLRQRLQDRPARVAGAAVPFTVSIGVATAYPDGAAAAGITQLMRHADTALYAAKDGGRNQVRAA